MAEPKPWCHAPKWLPTGGYKARQRTRGHDGDCDFGYRPTTIEGQARCPLCAPCVTEGAVTAAELPLHLRLLHRVGDDGALAALLTAPAQPALDREVSTPARLPSPDGAT